MKNGEKRRLLPSPLSNVPVGSCSSFCVELEIRYTRVAHMDSIFLSVYRTSCLPLLVFIFTPSSQKKDLHGKARIHGIFLSVDRPSCLPLLVFIFTPSS